MNHYFLGACIIIGSVIIALNIPNVRFPKSILCTAQPMKIFTSGNATLGISSANVIADGNTVTSNLNAGYMIRCD